MMQASFSHTVVKLDETTKIFVDSILPAAKTQKGYRGAYLLTDRNTGKARVLSLWGGEEDAVANEQSDYYHKQIGKAAPFFTAPPVREGYEVSALH